MVDNSGYYQSKKMNFNVIRLLVTIPLMAIDQKLILRINVFVLSIYRKLYDLKQWTNITIQII